MALQAAKLLKKKGAAYIVRELFLTSINAAVMFAAAGTLHWFNAWFYIALVLCQQMSMVLFLSLKNPELLRERGVLLKEGTNTFDRIFLLVFPLSSLIISATAGLDAVRYQWSPLPFWLIAPGSIIFIFAAVLGIWAMSVNRNFELTIRIQADREHRVCDSGPYSYIRHPGYAAWLLAAISYPLILGSLLSALPVTVLSLIFIARTAVEDSFLMEKLNGYREYAKRVKYRLIPYLW